MFPIQSGLKTYVDEEHCKHFSSENYVFKNLLCLTHLDPQISCFICGTFFSYWFV